MSNNSKARLWRIARSALFQFDPERAHHLAIWALKRRGMWGKAMSVPYYPVHLDHGLSFPNPVGLAAGMDKNGECLLGWQSLGFGSVEVGTVTPYAQTGNAKPRLFRLPQHQAILNRMGFNNQGAQKVRENLEMQRRDGRLSIPIGVNIGKGKATELHDAQNDYVHCFEVLADVADYVAINVSSPNTPHLRQLQAPDALKKILTSVMDVNAKRRTGSKPIFLKIAPDMTLPAAHAVAELAVEQGVSALIVSNTTLDRPPILGLQDLGEGGLSGDPLFQKSTTLLSGLSQAYSDKICFVGVGGITDGPSAMAKHQAGARLLQVYTGFVYGGPWFVRSLLSLYKDPKNEALSAH